VPSAIQVEERILPAAVRSLQSKVQRSYSLPNDPFGVLPRSFLKVLWFDVCIEGAPVFHCFNPKAAPDIGWLKGSGSIETEKMLFSAVS